MLLISSSKAPLERMGSNYNRLRDKGKGKIIKTVVQDNLWRGKADEKETVEAVSAERRCSRGLAPSARRPASTYISIGYHLNPPLTSAHRFHPPT